MLFIVGTEKGGAGKSTIAQNLAYRLVRGSRGTTLSVQLVDTDTTSTSAQWIDRREHFNVEPRIELMRALKNPESAIVRSNDSFDAVVVDTGARSYENFREFARIADLWIAPVQVGMGDLDSALAMHEALRRLDKSHKSERVPICFVLNRTSTNPNSSEEADAREYLLGADPEFPLIGQSIRERKVWRDAQKVGRSIFEMPAQIAQKARQEFNNVLAEAMKYKSKVGA